MAARTAGDEAGMKRALAELDETQVGWGSCLCKADAQIRGCMKLSS